LQVKVLSGVKLQKNTKNKDKNKNTRGSLRCKNPKKKDGKPMPLQGQGSLRAIK
jgi:hypothetical protein